MSTTPSQVHKQWCDRLFLAQNTHGRWGVKDLDKTENTILLLLLFICFWLFFFFLTVRICAERPVALILLVEKKHFYVRSLTNHEKHSAAEMYLHNYIWNLHILHLQNVNNEGCHSQLVLLNMLQELTNYCVWIICLVTNSNLNHVSFFYILP